MNTTHLYRKKPVTIEAFQMTEERRNSNADWPEWLNEAWNKPFEEVGSLFLLGGAMIISTLEGNVVASPNDWIIKGVKGELYPCRPDIFEMTYEKVEDSL